MKNKIFFKIGFIATLFFFSGCETLDLDQLEDPSTASQSELDPVYAFNYVQLQLADFVDSSNRFTQAVTRQMAMTGGDSYDNAFAPVNFNNNWTIAYDILNTVKVMEPKSIENKEFLALGAAKVIRCYVLMTLVDMYGNVPLTEALLGGENLNPKYDSGSSVYKQVLLDLDDAIVVLGKTSNSDSKVQDLYYKKSISSWITLAKTLKLKMYNTARLAGSDIGVSNIGAEMNAILSAGDYIDTKAEDFAFQYGSNRDVPNSRHPLYNDQYELGGGAYIANYFMWALTIEKGINSNEVVDPRTAFYFFKQTANPASEDTFTIPGRTRPDHYNDAQYYSFFDSAIRTPYTVSNWFSGSAVASSGYLGRDHGNNSGIPPDATLRTVAGLYPVGGAYGSTAASVQTSGIAGALGAGIMPMVLSSYVHFIKAEAILEAGVSGDAKAELLAGISASIDKVTTPVNDYPILSASDIAAIATKKTDYLTFISDFYDTLSPSKKLELIIKEYYIAAWGNGIEPYNNYRRTGFPSNFQPTLEPVSGAFYYSALYSADSASNNPNTPSNVRTRKVFWDKAGIVLH